MSRSANSLYLLNHVKTDFSHSPFLPGCIYPKYIFRTGDIFMAPDTQSIDCTTTFLTLGLALSHPFDTPGDDPEYTDRETLSAAIKRVGLDDDDEDDDDADEEEDEDDFNEKAVDDDDEDEDEEDEDFEDDEEEDEEDDDDLDDDEDDEIDEDENDDDIKLI
jgi:hypothetical protein